MLTLYIQLLTVHVSKMEQLFNSRQVETKGKESAPK